MTRLCAVAQTVVETYVPGTTLEGVTYFLPRTAFRVTVVAKKTVVRPGEFAPYAERYLSMSNVPEEEQLSWELDNIKVEPFGVPDRNKAYSIKLKSKTVAPLVGLSRDGILLSINTDAQEDVLPELPKAIPAKPLPNPRQYMTQEILAAGSNAKMAELCAQEIYDMRESRNALVRGEADNTPKDGVQLKLMLDQLETQISTLESLFNGTSQTSTEVFSFTVDPQKEGDQQMLFRFSRQLGVVDTENLAGEPVYMEVKCTESLPEDMPNEQTAKKKEKMDKGVYYNVPRRTMLRVYALDKEYVKAEYPMGQFGKVEILSNLLFDKKTTTKVTFFQTTGGTKDVME